MTTRILVLGANFAGMTAALSVKHDLGDDADVTVVSADDHFLFTPSLIWMPFGRRHREGLTFPVAPTFDARGIDFVHAAATRLDPVARRVDLSTGASLTYDYLVIATGHRAHEQVVPGFLEHAQTITTLDAASRAAEEWQRFLTRPGDVVVAATQGAGCFGAAYEFLFHTSHQLRKAGLHQRVRLTYVTAEPFLGHFGVGGLPHGEELLGMYLAKEGIETRLSVAVDHVEDGALVLVDGESLPFSFGMVVPPFLGQEFLGHADGLADGRRFIRVRPTYQSEHYDDVYAVGVAAAVDAPWQTPTPVGTPRTGFPSEVMAHTAAANIASQVRGDPPCASQEFDELATVCVVDAANHGVIVLADTLHAAREHGVLIPGRQAHLMKLGFEKYYLWKMRHGYAQLP